jgi:hypothetical protein
MNFATFVILVLALVALIVIVTRWGPSSAARGTQQQQQFTPPDGPPCPNCGQPRGQLDHYCRRCGQSLLPPPQDPPAQGP